MISKSKKLVFTLRLNLAVRDSQCVRGVARDLLLALINRSSYSKNGRLGCWPSYGLLAQDTLRNERSLRRAAKVLEDAGLIYRVYRGDSSNHFFINEKLIMKHAEEMKIFRETQKANKKEAEDDLIETQFESVGWGFHDQATVVDSDWNNFDEEDMGAG